MRRAESSSIRYSGLETKGLKKMSCSLLLPSAEADAMKIQCLKLWAKPQVVTVKIDYGSPHYSVDFPGAGVIAVSFEDATEESSESGPTKFLFLAGKCRYSPADRKEYSVMMRTKKEGKAQGLGRNSEYTWPGVESFELCPVCAAPQVAKKRSKEYCMVFQMLMSKGFTARATKESFIATRLHPQLACVECIESLLKGKAFSDTSESVLGALNRMPGMPLFVGPDRSGYNEDGKNIGLAWPLYVKWSQTGSFDALSNTVAEVFKTKMGGDGPKKVADAKAKTCLVCKVVMLPGNAKVCSRCHKASYCSRECQAKDWKRHKVVDCVIREVKPEFHRKAGFQAAPSCRCKMCHKTDIDQDLMIMCFACGTVQMCGACHDKSADDYRGGPVICQACAEANPKVAPNTLVQTNLLLDNLLARLPEDAPQKNLVRLMIAQCRLQDDFELTGYQQDTRYAKKEILDLADAGYYLAQSVATDYYMRDIIEEHQIFHGPLFFLKPPRMSDIPFVVDHNKAKKYCLQAIKTGCPMALNDVGLLFKNGVLFETDRRRALDLFEKAVEAGDAKGLCNAAQIYYRGGDGITIDVPKAIGYYKRAVAEHDKATAKFMLIQFDRNTGGGVILTPEELHRYLEDIRDTGLLESLR